MIEFHLAVYTKNKRHCIEICVVIVYYYYALFNKEQTRIHTEFNNANALLHTYYIHARIRRRTPTKFSVS